MAQSARGIPSPFSTRHSRAETSSPGSLIARPGATRPEITARGIPSPFSTRHSRAETSAPGGRSRERAGRRRGVRAWTERGMRIQTCRQSMLQVGECSLILTRQHDLFTATTATP